MNRIFISLFIMFCITAYVSAGTQSGKWGLAAPLTNTSGMEIALSKMSSPSIMYLAGFNVGFSKVSEESKIANSTNPPTSGTKTTAVNFEIVPELRSYLWPNDRISPYWGFLVMLGYGQENVKTPAGSITIESKTSDIFAGLGLSFGVEYFMSKYLSLFIHTRLLSYKYSSEKSESASSDPIIHTIRRHSLSALIYTALYLRLYF